MSLLHPDLIRKASVIIARDARTNQETVIFKARGVRGDCSDKLVPFTYVEVRSQHELMLLAAEVTAVRGRNDFVRSKRKKLLDFRRTASETSARLQMPASYPRFDLATTDGPAEFVDLITQALARIDFTDGSMFEPWQQELWSSVRRNGTRRTMVELQKRCRADGVQYAVAHATWAIGLGQRLFDLLGADVVRRFVPFSDVFVGPKGQDIAVHIRSLRREPGPNGSVYYSRHEPTVGGRVVAFSRHAIERVVERFCLSGLTYAAAGDVFGFFSDCLDFEHVSLHPGLPGFTFFEDCAKGFLKRRIAVEVLGDKYNPLSDYRYRVGYCPAVVEGRFLKAKTFLYPGNRATPEYGALLAADLPLDLRRAMLHDAETMDADRFRRGADDWGLFRWFHEHGVEQVRPGKARYAQVVAK